MGARVVRSQTLGDSVNCELCIEPKEGVFNPEAFKSIDYSIKAAHDRGLRLIVTLAGDCATCALSGPGQYLIWTGKLDFKAFYTDPVVIAAFEKHIEAMLNHKNSLTGIAYKDDPTIMAWENCNVCGLGAVWTAPGQSLAPFIPWVDTIGSFIKSIDKRHLYIDNSGFFQYDKALSTTRRPTLLLLNTISTGTRCWARRKRQTHRRFQSMRNW
jgi:mannan endo-1,4-beta-mannosidase